VDNATVAMFIRSCTVSDESLLKNEVVNYIGFGRTTAALGKNCLALLRSDSDCAINSGGIPLLRNA
jgi:hypothetical protein